jgi:hypothetical protein
MTASTGYQWGQRPGVAPSLATRAKLSAALMGNRRGAANFQKVRTPEARARCSAAVLAWWRKRREAEPMPPRWQMIADMHASGLNPGTIGKALGISRQRVCQILKKIERRSEA